MKFSVLSLLLSLLHKSKKILIGIGLLLIVAACVFFGWRHYQFKNSPQKTMQNITQALHKAKLEHLAVLIDFRTLSESFARQMLQDLPKDAALPPVTILAEQIQQRILDNFTKPEEQPKGVKANPFAPLNPLPAGTLAQIGTSITLEKVEDNFALAHAKVDYPRAEKTFNLIFQLEKKGDAPWRLTKINNAHEIIQSFLEAQQSIDKQKSDTLAAKNAEQQQRMDSQLVVNSCTAVAGLLSDGKTALLSVEILARNPGPHAVLNFNVKTLLTGKKHSDKTISFLLNLAKRTLQGENFAHTWNIALDPQNPEHQYLLAERTLQCTTTFNNMGLSSGEVLFVRKNLQ